MSKAIRVLKEEHRWIRLLLECLDQMVVAYRSEEEFDAEAAAELQRLFEHFVDKQHQMKEEDALLPKLLERMQDLRRDHVEESKHLDRMRFNLFGAQLGDPAGRATFIREAETYAELQRQHMAYETLTFLPLGEQLLTEEDDRAVLDEFQRREAESLSREEIEERVRRLCERLDIE